MWKLTNEPRQPYPDTKRLIGFCIQHYIYPLGTKTHSCHILSLYHHTLSSYISVCLEFFRRHSLDANRAVFVSYPHLTAHPSRTILSLLDTLYDMSDERILQTDGVAEVEGEGCSTEATTVDLIGGFAAEVGSGLTDYTAFTHPGGIAGDVRGDLARESSTINPIHLYTNTNHHRNTTSSGVESTNHSSSSVKSRWKQSWAEYKQRLLAKEEAIHRQQQQRSSNRNRSNCPSKHIYSTYTVLYILV